MGTPVKVLFVGDARGDLATLLKKVNTINAKSGPFAAALVTGQLLDGQGGLGSDVAALPTPSLPVHFLGAGPQGSLPEGLESDKLQYLGRSGVATIAGLTVAFLDGCYDAATYGPEEGAPPARAGHTSVNSGRDGLYRYSRRDVAELHRAVQKLEGEVDVLLTCEWPRGITAGLEGCGAPAAPPEGVNADSGSTVVAEAAMLCRPRYHIASGEEVAFARLPYANRDLGVGIRVTRFVALGPISGKSKSLHALALVPASELDPATLAQKPEACTPSPLEAAVAAAAMDNKRKGDQDLPNAADWRWQQQQPKRPRIQHVAINHRPNVTKDPASTVVARNVPFVADEQQLLEWFGKVGTVVDMFRGLNDAGKLNSWMIVQFENPTQAQRALQTLNNSQLLGREVALELSHQKPGGERMGKGPAQPTASENCWFCLGSSAADVGLVVSVAEEAYLALDKGAISDTHVLVVPIDHAASSTDLKARAFEEIERYMSALSSYYASKGLALVAFERFLALRKTGAGGNHCHVNVIGVPKEAVGKAQDAFQQALKAADLGEFEVLQMGEGAGASALQAALRGSLAGAGVGHASCSSYPEYFQAILPGGVRLVRAFTRQERLPLNLGREVLAGLVGDPGRADWKVCTQSEEQVAAAAEAFKAAFGPYDPSGPA